MDDALLLDADPTDPDGNVLAAPALSSAIFERLGRGEDHSPCADRENRSTTRLICSTL